MAVPLASFSPSRNSSNRPLTISPTNDRMEEIAPANAVKTMPWMNSDAPSLQPYENPCGADQGYDRGSQCQEEPLEDLPNQPVTANSWLLCLAASPPACDNDASQEPDYRQEGCPSQHQRPIHIPTGYPQIVGSEEMFRATYQG